jgi:tetratricopeptide (TPR) repeat protein/predicted Ser/Thr protein kinase
VNAAPDQLGFTLDDETWLGVVRDSLAPVLLGGIGDFKLLEELGRGSQGAVFKAVQPGTNRTVAVKRVPGGPLAGAATRARLAREVEALSALSHPGIVTVHGVEPGGGGDSVLLVMEFVDGVPIDRWAKDRPVRDRAAAFALLADAIAHAHRKGVIHRDLKPSNVLVGGDGQPRVLDFGLATLFDPTGAGAIAMLSIAGSGFLGTPAYASPEQLQGDRAQLDTRSDIYTLGVMLFQALTGKLPFPETDLAALVAAVQRGSTPRPSSLNRDVDKDLDAVTLTALAPEPSARYQSADALAADLRRWLAGEPVAARPPTRVDKAIRAVRRSPLASTAVVAACVATITLAAVASVQTIRLQRRTRNAEQTVATLRQMIATVTAAAAARDAEPVQAMIDATVKRLEADAADHDPATLNALWLELAHAAYSAELFDQFGRAVQTGLPAAEKLYGREHPVTADWITCQGLDREQRSDLAGARALYEEALAILRRVAPENDPGTSRAANNLGGIYRRQREFDAADKMLTEALAMRRAVNGPRHETVASTIRNLASNARDRGDLNAADRLYKEALEALPEATESASIARLAILHNYGRLLRDLKRNDDCIALCDDALKTIAAARGPVSPIAARFHNLRAQVFTRMKRYEDALAACAARDACDIRVAADHGGRAANLIQTADLLMRLERWDEAAANLTRARAAADNVDPPDPALIPRIEAAQQAAKERRRSAQAPPNPEP